MTQHILSPDEFIVRSVNSYPSLFAAPSYNEVKFRVLDHMLNTEYNGIEMEEFFENPTTDKENSDAQKWFHCKKAAHGYTKTRRFGKGEKIYEIPEGDPEVTVPVDERDNFPEIVYWVNFDCSNEYSPYPNFEKEYSVVWNSEDIQFDELGEEWAEAAKWFYNQCRDYFMDDERVKGYHSSFPKKTDSKTINIINDYKKCLTQEMYPTNDDISEAYECEFIGDRNSDSDVADFIQRRWNIEHQRILAFIDETIEHINEIIEAHYQKQEKPNFR